MSTYQGPAPLNATYLTGRGHCSILRVFINHGHETALLSARPIVDKEFGQMRDHQPGLLPHLMQPIWLLQPILAVLRHRKQLLTLI